MAGKIMSMPRRHIFYLSTSLNIGGSETNLFRLVKHFMDEYDVTVAVLKEAGYFGGILAQNGIKVVHLPGIWAVASYLRKNSVDILHSFLYRANITGRIAGRIAGVPIIISSRRAIDKWRNAWQVVLNRLSDGLANHIVCNSQASSKELVNEGYPQSRISVIYNGVDNAVFNMNESQDSARNTLGLTPAEPIALIVARLHLEKGIDLLPAIASKMPRGIFVVAGDGPLKKPFIDELKKLGLFSRFVFLGWRQDVASLMRAADFMLMPSREESFPQAGLEAAACGIPIVGFDIGGMRELVEDGQSGFLVSYMNIQAFADAANIFAIDRARARRMGALACSKAVQYSLKAMLTRTEELYKSLLLAHTQRK